MTSNNGGVFNLHGAWILIFGLDNLFRCGRCCLLVLLDFALANVGQGDVGLVDAGLRGQFALVAVRLAVAAAHGGIDQRAKRFAG